MTIGEAIEEFAARSSRPDLLRTIGHTVCDLITAEYKKEPFTAEQEAQIGLAIAGLLINIDRAFAGLNAVKIAMSKIDPGDLPS